MHLISMKKGGNLAAVYRKLIRAIEEIGKCIQFTRHPRLGYLTFCSTNLGTAIRASVHIRLPNLARDYDRFQQITKMYRLQMKEIKGEHSEGEDSVYYLSNKRRMELTKWNVLLKMRNDMVKLIKQEKKLFLSL